MNILFFANIIIITISIIFAVSLALTIGVRPFLETFPMTIVALIASICVIISSMI
jgi:antibiotic biosynthesis monooxygenase (ABM) superfamily enzyme